MASAIEVLINGVLKYVGFTREQFDEGVKNVRTEVESFRTDAVDAKREIVEMGRLVRRIADHLGIGETVGTEGDSPAVLRLVQVPQPDSEPSSDGDAASN